MNANADTTDLTNQSIAGFSILHRLGVGGMSEVYLAFQESLHRHVALKVMRADFVGSSDHEQRFLQEARAVASLMHPNIVQVYDVGKYEAIHYIAQEYVPGSNLFSYVQRRGALPLAESISILWQTTSALQKAASIGLVHRDIKPDNILLRPDGEVKVADFGLARARGQSLNLTAVGVTLGSPLYMSPEQIQGLSVDSRSDLYSLGATAYHMLTGRPPFSGETALALAMQHLQAAPTPLEQLRPDLPMALVNIVHRLLAKNPDERFASAVELARALKEVVDDCLAGQANQMVPFAGLIIEHQQISNLDVTQELQKLSKSNTVSKNHKPSRLMVVGRRIALAAGSILIGFVLTTYLLRDDLFENHVTSTIGVVHQTTIEKQFALALVENDLKHWKAVSENFPAKDPMTLSYELKANLQIARLQIERENFPEALKAVRRVLDAKSDGVLRAIAAIEMGYLKSRQSGEQLSNFDDAIIQMSLLDTEKQKVVEDSLPRNVLTAWDNIDLARQEKSKSSS